MNLIGLYKRSSFLQMQRIILTVFLFAIFFNAHSQGKKIMLIGGDVAFMYSSHDLSDLKVTRQFNSLSGGFIPGSLLGTIGSESPADFKTLYIDLHPELMLYVKENFLIGFGLDFLTQQSIFDSDLITNSTTTAAIFSPAIRYYLSPEFYGQVQGNIGKSHEKIISEALSIPLSTGFGMADYSTDIEGSVIGFAAVFGYSLQLGENIISDISVKYFRNSITYSYENISEEGRFIERQNMVLFSVGLKYLLKQ